MADGRFLCNKITKTVNSPLIFDLHWCDIMDTKTNYLEVFMKTQHTTQASTPTAKADILVLMEQQVSFYDLRICYRLLAEGDKHGTHFLICANGNDEALCPVGYDLISAMRYFNTVVR